MKLNILNQFDVYKLILLTKLRSNTVFSDKIKRKNLGKEPGHPCSEICRYCDNNCEEHVKKK